MMRSEYPDTKHIQLKDDYSNASNSQTQSMVWTVSDLNEQVKQTLETQIGQVWVRGEISGFVVAGSGHWYFQLKDAQAQVKVAMFRMRAASVALQPKNGDEVEICAEVGLYVPRGEYQLVALSMRAVGAGRLYELFLKNKTLLANEGLFDAQRKKKIPFFVQRVAVITSPNAAALHDVVAAITRRAPYVEICLFPTAVQGAGSAQGVMDAISLANHVHATGQNHFDVILLVRGGGSMEDLWTFNEIEVARAVAVSQLPVVSGIGHESDISLVDFVADVRAATPTAAAELVAKAQQEWIERIDYNQQRLARSVERIIERLFQHLDHLSARVPSPRQKLLMWQMQLQQLTHRLMQSSRNVYADRAQRLKQLEFQIKRNVQTQTGVVFYKTQLVAHHKALQLGVRSNLQMSEQRLAQLALRLEKYNPQAPLARGYALVYREKGNKEKSKELIRAVEQVHEDDRLSIHWGAGHIDVLVQSKINYKKTK